MKKIRILFCCLLMATAFGCRQRVLVNGNSYEALTAREEEMLKAIALKTLEKNVGKSVLDSELRYARANDPELTIDYYGDRSGDARISWMTPTRKITLVFSGELLSKQMGCIMQTVDEQPEIVDFTDVPVSKSIKGVPPEPPRKMRRSSSAIIR